MENKLKKGKLFLIPNLIADTGIHRAIPPYNSQTIRHIKHFAAESPKGARLLLKQIELDTPLDDIEWYSIHKKKGGADLDELVELLKNGNDVGMISDAGCPAVADPGENLVYQCHVHQIEVIPLVGPSSILLALMASGLNGQNFHFIGYLPKEKSERTRELKKMEDSIHRSGTTFIFIETPYRNLPLMDEMVKTLNHQTKLCVASHLTSDQEIIITKSIENWKKHTSILKIEDVPTIFLLGK